ncbi:hypothetical protein MMC18_000154 [Xylographa bjoerkii]|nr:hypothetical protein [Xylographa bjoerkii]
METITISSPSAFLKSALLTPSTSTIRPKKAAKKKIASSRIEKTAAIAIDGLVKPKQSKSRNGRNIPLLFAYREPGICTDWGPGCVTCKAKRLKCDETKPTCQQCHKRGVDCGGYKKDFKWRSFEETSFMSKPAPLRIRKPSIPTEASQPHPESPCASDASGSTVLPPFSQLTPSASFIQFSPVSPYVQQSLASTSASASSSFDASLPTSVALDRSIFSEIDQPTSTPNSLDAIFEGTGTLERSNTANSSFTSGQSPRLIDLLLPGTDLNAPPQDYVEFQPLQSDTPYQPGPYIPMQEETFTVNEDVEEILRQPIPAAEAWIMRLPSLSPSASSSSSSAESSSFDLLNIYSQPKLDPRSPEMLMLGFDTQTCGILSVKDGPTENPWRTHVWPLARDCPALYHAISSMAAFHTSKSKPSMKVAGMEHMRRSIRHLASGIENMRIDTALATTLVLAFSESWDVHISTGIEHLRGAKVLVNQALTRHRQNSLDGEDLIRLRFLYNTWVYMDVIARLTNVDDEDPGNINSSLWTSFDPFGSTTEVDPLMGCATTLFPLIGCVANLVRKVRKSNSNSINIISQANELKTHLETWEPPSFFEPPEDPTSEIQDSLQTAEAYRWATLLYLRQAVPEIPTLSAAQLAKKVLIYLATVPPGSRAIIVQIYPLLAAGCEAVTVEDRAWVEDRWTMMSRRMLIGNVDRCLEVVKEVWRRRDADEAEKMQERNRRVASRMTSYLGSPMSSMKRAFSAEEQAETDFFEWPDAYAGIKRRATEGDSGMPTPVRVNRAHKSGVDNLDNIDFETTVRGRLHWAGVMRDWEWEVLLG